MKWVFQYYNSTEDKHTVFDFYFGQIYVWKIYCYNCCFEKCLQCSNGVNNPVCYIK